MTAVALGVIADARVIQKRRRRLWIGAAAALLVAAAAFALAGHSRSDRIVTVRVILRYDAPPSAVRRVLATVRAEPQLAGVSVTTPPEALRRLRAKYPKLVAGLTYNPLPESLDVRVRSSDGAPAVAARLRHRLGASVQLVRVQR